MTPSGAEAEQLIEDFGLMLPIKPREVCEQVSTKEVEVEYSEILFDSEDICGLSIGNGQKIKVVINSGINNSGRRNFTGAHEIGHVVLHIQKNIQSEFSCTNHDISNANKTNSIYEKEANAFASSLLMPKYLLGKAVLRNDLTWALIQDLAIKCKTSLEAAARRVIKLSDESCALVIHKKGEMWAPIRSASFNGYIDTIDFPKGLVTNPDEPGSGYPDYLNECDATDWFRDKKKLPEIIQYLSIYNELYDRRMTLIVVPEEEDEDVDDGWDEPHF